MATDTRAPAVRSLLGIFAIVFAVLTAVLLIVGIVLAYDKNFPASTSIGYAAIASSVVGFGMGLAAVITRRGRALGVIAMLLCVAANPLVLSVLLQFLSGLVAVG